MIRTISRIEGRAHAFFYFDNRDGNNASQTYDTLIRSTAYQFYRNLDRFPQVIMDTYKSCGSGTSAPSRELLEAILFSALQHLPHAFIIIDALDESPNFSPVGKWLQRMMAADLNGLHVLVTSRKERHIHDCLHQIPRLQTICVDERTGDDLNLYIHSQIQESLLCSWPDEIKDNIQVSLHTRADGMSVPMSYCYNNLINPPICIGSDGWHSRSTS